MLSLEVIWGFVERIFEPLYSHLELVGFQSNYICVTYLCLDVWKYFWCLIDFSNWYQTCMVWLLTRGPKIMGIVEWILIFLYSLCVRFLCVVWVSFLQIVPDWNISALRRIRWHFHYLCCVSQSVLCYTSHQLIVNLV